MSLVSPSNVLHIFHLFWRALDILYRLTMLAHQFVRPPYTALIGQHLTTPIQPNK